jgi:ABC-type microcin C transport system permease subunit YejB
MIVYIIKRLLMVIPILLGISLICLILIDIAPGDPAEIIVGIQDNEGDHDAKVAAVREELGA